MAAQLTTFLDTLLDDGSTTAAVGGFLFLRLFGLNFSISASAGAIVLSGVTFLTGMMLVSE